MARLTTSADVTAYGAAIIVEGMTPMQVNDVIFFLADKNQYGIIYNQTAWTSARNGATLWIEAGSYNCVQIGSAIALTMPSDVNNPNHIHFFNGQGQISRVASGLAARTLQFENYNYLIVDFETNSKPGMRDGWGSGKGNSFGVRESNTLVADNSHGLHIQNHLGTFKRLEIRGCELTTGDFAKIRASFDKNELDSFIIERCLITRSIGGEGFYIGTTAGAPRPCHGNFKVRDNLIICTAAEAIQLQQLGDGSEIHNNVVWCSGHDFRAAFQTFQDTGVQLDMVQGNVKFYNNIVHGYASNGTQLFAADISGQVPSKPFGSGVPQIYNNCFSRAKWGVSFRLHSSFNLAVRCVFRDNDVISIAGNYEVEPDVNYVFDVDETLTPVQIIGGRLPVGSVILNPAEDNTKVRHFGITQVAQNEPQFVNDGFINIPVEKIARWVPAYTLGRYSSTSVTSVNPATLVDGGTVSLTVSSSEGFAPGHTIRVRSRADITKGFYATVNTYSGSTLSLNAISQRTGTGASIDWDVDRRISYVTTDFVLLGEDGTSLPVLFYKCILPHDGHANDRPDLAPTKWAVVNWDSQGKNQYDPAYNNVPFTTDFMVTAGDFRLVKGSTHHLLGRGLSCNEQRDDQTMMGWQWKQTPTGTVRDIPGAYSNKLVLSRYSYLIPGRYYRYWVDKLNNISGLFETREYSAWSEVT